LHQKVRTDILKDLSKGYLFMEVDETTDRKGRMVLCILLGQLSIDGVSKPHLIAAIELDVCNSKSVSKAIDEEIGVLNNYFK